MSSHTTILGPVATRELANTLYASFVDCDQAVKAAGALMDHGLRHDDLSILSHGTEDDLGRWPAVRRSDDEAEAMHGVTVTTMADASAGATDGARIGLGVGLVAGLASLLVPGFGLVFGGGALATALAGAAMATGGGAVAGGVTGYLKDQGVPDDSAATYYAVVAHGGAVVVLSLPSNDIGEFEARDLLIKYGGQNVGSHVLLS